MVWRNGPLALVDLHDDGVAGGIDELVGAVVSAAVGGAEVGAVVGDVVGSEYSGVTHLPNAGIKLGFDICGLCKDNHLHST